jgi:23S rRNA pseudouridine2457 synthase
LSDDGTLIHRLTDPRYKLPKTYYAQVEGVPTEEALERLRRGLLVKGYRTQPCQARILHAEPNLPPRAKSITPHGPTAWLEIILSEGRKRQVRHMTAAVGLPTLRLVRAAIGVITLDGLQPGEWRDLSQRELDFIISHHAITYSNPSPRLRARRQKPIRKLKGVRS